MMKFRRGETVLIPCKIQPGAFSGELLVTVETDKGVTSGFVRRNDIVDRGNAQFIPGEIIQTDSDSVEVRIPGSFFTTATGLTTVSSHWATDNLSKRSPGNK